MTSAGGGAAAPSPVRDVVGRRPSFADPDATPSRRPREEPRVQTFTG
ncbi:MAG: hypothetical protein LBE67_09670 [Kocuria palustris]|nr:hypothetical protein [Kocuria palustris]